MSNTETVLTRETIHERVWGFDGTFASNSLDVYVGYMLQFPKAGAVTQSIHRLDTSGGSSRLPMT